MEFDDFKAISGTTRPPQLRKLHTENGFGKATGANTPEQAVMRAVSEGIEEGAYIVTLEAPTRKVSQVTASGGAIRYRSSARRTAVRSPNTSDIGTCEITTGPSVSDFFFFFFSFACIRLARILNAIRAGCK